MSNSDIKPEVIASVRPDKSWGGSLPKQVDRIYSPRGVSPSLLCNTGGNREPKIMTQERVKGEPRIIQKYGDRGTSNYSVKDISNTIPANPMSDRGQLLVEPQNLDTTEKMKQKKITATTCAQRGRETGQRLEAGGEVANSLTTVQKDSMVIEPEVRYRIRKLTPRECFRLMDVDDADIDKIQAAGIAKTRQYKLAGNSIVVSCLYHLFEAMFFPDRGRKPAVIQLELF